MVQLGADGPPDELQSSEGPLLGLRHGLPLLAGAEPSLTGRPKLWAQPMARCATHPRPGAAGWEPEQAAAPAAQPSVPRLFRQPQCMASLSGADLLNARPILALESAIPVQHVKIIDLLIEGMVLELCFQGYISRTGAPATRRTGRSGRLGGRRSRPQRRRGGSLITSRYQLDKSVTAKRSSDCRAEAARQRQARCVPGFALALSLTRRCSEATQQGRRARRDRMS